MSADNFGSSKARSAAYGLLGLLVAAAVIYIYSYYVYGSSADGIAFAVGEITGSFLLIFLIGFAISRKLSMQLFSVCLILACAVFLFSNLSALKEAIAVKRGHDLLTSAKSYEDILAISSRHPENKLLRFLGTVMQFRMSSQKRFVQLFAPATLIASQCPNQITSLNKQSYDECIAFYGSKLLAQAKLRDELPKVFIDQRTQATLMFDKLEKGDPWVDQAVIRNAKEGLHSSSGTAEKSAYELVDKLMKTTKGLQDLFEFLSENVQSMHLESGRLVFANAKKADTYNQLVGDIGRSEEAYLNAAHAVQQTDQGHLNSLTQ